MLGVTLDSKLSWTPHIRNKIKACKRALMQLKPVLGKTWSPKPKYTKWLYEGVILPMLSYGAIVWASSLSKQNNQTKLKKLQRLGLISIANVRKSTPTAALEIIYNIAPLHLQIQEKAINTYLRLGAAQRPNWAPHKKDQIGHLQLSLIILCRRGGGFEFKCTHAASSGIAEPVHRIELLGQASGSGQPDIDQCVTELVRQLQSMDIF